MADFQMKANDTLPVIEATLGLGTGSTADDLTALSATLANGATVVSFIMRKAGDPTAKVNAPATIVDSATRRVRYTWLPADTNTPGSYNAEWEVIDPSGKIRTYPTLTYHTIDILADLDEAGA